MDRPLWQILFAMTLVAFAVARVATGFVLAETPLAPAVVVVHGVQAVAALGAALVIWLRREWTLAAFLGLGVILAASMLIPLTAR